MASSGDEKTEMSSGATKAIRKNSPKQRSPANYQPHNPHRSALTNAPIVHENDYPNMQIETHYNEPDSPLDQPMEAENNPPPEQEHSLVSNTPPENETLDQAMGAEVMPVEAPPEPVSEVSDF
jgi:hypothetical protein